MWARLQTADLELGSVEPQDTAPLLADEASLPVPHQPDPERPVPTKAVRLRVKTASGGDTTEHELHVRLSSQVRDLKRAVAAAIGAGGKHLRLISAGRLLVPDDAVLHTFRPHLHEDAVVHAVVSNVAPRPEHAASAAAAAAAATASSVLASDSEEEGPGRERHGFDRLRAQGLTREGVESVRTYFASQVTAFAEAQGDELNAPRDGEDDHDRRLRIEDAWIDAQGAQSEFGLNFTTVDDDGPLLAQGVLNAIAFLRDNDQGAAAGATVDPLTGQSEVGLPRDFMWGFLMGFFLGVIMLFWLWERSVTHRQKMGILTGVSCQLGLRYVKRLFDPDEAAVAGT